MTTAQKNEKMVRALPNDGQIVVTHITVRQSIFFLVLKLLILEILAAFGLVAFFALILSTQLITKISNSYYGYVIPFFALLVAIKTGILVYIVDGWLEDYYEIRPDEIIHKQGHIFKKEQHYTLKHVGVAKVEQNFLGRLFGFGSITLYDWVTSKDINMYLIHNPMKYYNILTDLLPEADIEKKAIRDTLIDEDEL